MPGSTRVSEMKLEPEWNGLKVLAEGEEPLVDIVFVHGLQGHPRHSWTCLKPSRPENSVAGKSSSRLLSRFRSSKQDASTTSEEDVVFWPLDFLPSDIRNARIVSFGYDSQIFGFFYGANNQNSLFAHARNLLQELIALRRHDSKRKLIFAAHSMGGLVVKDVLRRARNLRDQDRYKHLYESTYACIFFGTPHRGSDKTGWALLARRIALAVLQDSNDKLIRNLEPNDEALDLLREDFAHVLGERRIRIHTFQEERGISGVKGLSGKVVEASSSSLDDSMEDRQGIDADHGNMVKFSGATDPGYRKVKSTLEGDVLDIEVERAKAMEAPNIEMTEEKVALFDAMFFSYLHDIDNASKLPQEGTFEWLLDDPKYLACLEGTENRLLWISGKPGCGKSTIVTKIQQTISEQPNILLLRFAFKASEQDLASSAEGFFRGLLCQVLALEPKCFEFVLPVLRSGRDNQKPRFLTSASQLSVAFQKCLEVVRERRVLLLIDALDECSPESSDMVIDLLKHKVRLSTDLTGEISVILTSRPTQHIQHRLKDASKLEMHEMNRRDIATYVDTRAKVFVELYPQRFSDIQELMNIIAENAGGIFLWAVLVLDDLEKEAIQGKSIESLIQHFRAVPQALEGLYQVMLDRLLDTSPSDIEETDLLIKWVTLATRPLHLREIWAAWQLQETASDPAKFSSRYDAEVMARRVRARSGGLFEVVDVERESETFGSKETWTQSLVVPIHLSVYHFLRTQNSGPTSDSERSTPSRHHFKVLERDHFIIAQACTRYLGFRQNKDITDVVFYRLGVAEPDAKEPFPYVLQSWVYHSEQAESHGTCMYDCFADIAMKVELEDHSTYSYYDLEDIKSNRLTSLAAVAARCKLGLTLKRLIDEGTNWSSRTLLESNPCLAACHGNNLEGLKTLCDTCGLEPDIDCVAAAGKNGQLGIAKFLINRQLDSARKDAFLYKAMHEAAAGDHQSEEVARFLIEDMGADVNRPTDGTGGVETALQHASWAGRDQIAEILLINGADPNLRGEGGTGQPAALHRALHSGSDRIVQLLLDHGADVDIELESWGTPLMCTGRFGRSEMAKLLLIHGADPNKQSGIHANALQSAATRGNLQISTMLIEAGANVNAVGGRYHTAVQAAGYGRNPAVMKLLIENGADVNLEGGYYYVSPLNTAADSGDCNMLRMLLEAGAVVPQRRPFLSKRRRHFSRSALHAVLQHHNLEGVALLLDHGASIAQEDTAEVLQTAFRIQDLELCRKMMSKCDKGIQLNRLLIDTICAYGNTTAGAKAMGWAEEIINMILEEGADPNAMAPFEGAVPPTSRDLSQVFPDGSALQHAASQKRKNYIEMLIQNGADVNLCTPTGTPLQVACELGDLDLVRTLLEHGADVNLEIPMYGSHLQAAAQIRSNLGRQIPSDVEFRGESTSEMVDRFRTTPIGPPRNVNAENVHEIANLLLEHGADISYTGGELGTALHAAGSALNQGLVSDLLDAGANLHAIGGKFGTVLQAVTSAREFETHRIEFRDTRAEEVKMAIVSMLLRKGAEVNVEAGVYHNVLQSTAFSSKSKALLLLLLRNQANINVQGGRFGTALQAAAACRNHEYVSILLQHGAAANLTGGEYGSPLIAVFNTGLYPYHVHHRECVSLLLKHGADPNFADEWYGTPLHMAAEFEDAVVCKMLLEKGADVNFRAGRRLYPLLALAQKFTYDRSWWLEILNLFLEVGVNVHCQEASGCTALLYAARASRDGEFEACERLLEYGANVNAACDCHGSILGAAVDGYGDAKLLAFLIDRGADVSVLGEEQHKEIKRADLKSGGLYNLASKLTRRSMSSAEVNQAMTP